MCVVRVVVGWVGGYLVGYLGGGRLDACVNRWVVGGWLGGCGRSYVWAGWCLRVGGWAGGLGSVCGWVGRMLFCADGSLAVCVGGGLGACRYGGIACAEEISSSYRHSWGSKKASLLRTGLAQFVWFALFQNVNVFCFAQRFLFNAMNMDH